MGTLDNIKPTKEHRFYFKNTAQKPEFLKEYKHCLTDEVLDSVIVFYILNGDIVFSKLVLNIFNFPLNTTFDAFFLTHEQHKEMLESIPICEPIN